VLGNLKRIAQRSPAYLAVCISLVFSAVLLGGASSSPALDDSNWQNVLTHYQSLFHDVANDLRDYESKLGVQTEEFSRELTRLEKTKGQMMLWFSGSGDPGYLRYIMRSIGGLRHEAGSLFKPFAQVEEELADLAITLEEIEAEVKSLRGQTSTAEYLEALNKNLKDIDGLKVQLAAIRPQIEKSREAYLNFLSHLDEAQKSTVRKTETHWKTFYFRGMPGLFTSETWEELPRDIEHWKTVDRLWRSVLSSPEEEAKYWKLLLKGFLLAVGIVLVCWLAIVKITGRLPRGFSRNGLLAAWILFCCWASITLVYEDISFVLCPLVFTLSEILLSSALVCLRICLSSGAGENRKSRTTALWALWGAASIGLLLRAVIAPYAIALVVWIVGMLSSFIVLRKKAASGGRLLERLPTTAAAYSFLGFGLLAVIGFLSLSMLFMSVFFYASASAELGLDLARFLKKLKNRVEEKYSEVSSYFMGILAGVGPPLIFLALVYLNLWLLSLRLGGETVLDSILSTQAGWRDYHVSFKNLALMILGFYITKSAVFVAEFFAGRLPETRKELDPAIVEALRTTARYLCWGFFVICALSLLGFNLMSLTVVAGGLSVGIGFGLQHIVNNLFSGLILLLGRSIQSGDTIQIEGMLGEVRKVTIRNTIVQTRDNATLFVPNSDLITNKLINWSHRDRRVVRRVAVGVAYGSDTEKIKTLLLQAAASHPRVLSAPPPQVLFSEFGPSTLDFQVKFWIDDVDSELQVLSDVRYHIDRLFRENGVEIAFPQSTLHLQTAPALEKLLADRAQEQAAGPREPSGVTNPKSSPGR